jgi:hypothetical protein
MESAKNQCCQPLEIFIPHIEREILEKCVHFLYLGQIPCLDTNKSCQILNTLTQIFGFPSRMELNCPKVKCKFCGDKFHIQRAGKHVIEEIENVMKICRIQLKSGHDITCQVCNILIEYRRTDENKEDTIRDHYLNLHSGDIFCNPKEKIRIKVRQQPSSASSKKKGIGKSSSNNKSQKKSDSNGLGLKLKIDLKNKNVKKMDHTCTECNQVFDNPMKFYRHFRLKHKEIVQKSWHKCVCGKTFPDKQSLQRHQSAYLCGKDKLPINCNECGFFLGYQGTDMAVKTHKKHMLKEHPEFVKNKWKPCPGCEERFPTQHALQCHLKRCNSKKKLALKIKL